MVSWVVRGSAGAYRCGSRGRRGGLWGGNSIASLDLRLGVVVAPFAGAVVGNEQCCWCSHSVCLFRSLLSTWCQYLVRKVWVRVRCAFRLCFYWQRLLQRPPSNSSSSFLCLCIFLLRCCEEYQPLLISVSVIRLILCWSCNCCCGYCRITTSDVDKQSQPPIIQAIHPTHAFS